MRSSQEQELPAIQILGVRVDCVDFQQTLDLISAWTAQSRAQAEERAKSSEKTEDTSQSAGNRKENEISDGHTHSSPFPRQVCTVNPEFIMAARRHPAFAQALAAADLCTPDGIGVLWAARLAGVRLDERVTGSDAIYRLCERAAAQGWRIFFLGAAAGVAERAAAELSRLYPGLRVAGTYGGSPAEADWPQIPPASRRRAGRSALRRLRASPPGHLDSAAQRRVAGRGGAGRRRRLRLRRRHHLPRAPVAAPSGPGVAIPAGPPAMALAPHGRPAPVRAARPGGLGAATAGKRVSLYCVFRSLPSIQSELFQYPLWLPDDRMIP